MVDLKIDSSKTALVAIDVQKGIFTLDRKLEPNTVSQVVSNVSKLVAKFRDSGMPVFLVRDIRRWKRHAASRNRPAKSVGFSPKTCGLGRICGRNKTHKQR